MLFELNKNKIRTKMSDYDEIEPPEETSPEVNEVLMVDTPLLAISTPGVEWENVTMEEINEDMTTHRVIGAKGVPWDSMSAKNVRKICICMKMKGYKKMKKAELIELIQVWWRNKMIYNQLQAVPTPAFPRTRTPPPRKEVGCSFRLMNVLFSDYFASDFGQIGNTATRPILDSGMAGNDRYFWERVQRSFVDEEQLSYNRLRFADQSEIIAMQYHINPGKIIQHGWSKLRTIWKAINAEYKLALG